MSPSIHILARHGAPHCVVVVKSDAPAHQLAAEELSDHLSKALGGPVPITTQRPAASPGLVQLVIGELDTTDFADEEYAIQSGDGVIHFAGRDTGQVLGSPRQIIGQSSPGTLYAVYHFLDHCLGVRWLWPGAAGTYIPRYRSLELPPLDVRTRPDLEQRCLRGVLFLDELPEFRRHVVEALRQPLEDHAVTITRAQITLSYPARFTLVAAMNPCPCGYLSDTRRTCTCSPAAIHRYRARISGPLLDRIDMHIEVPALAYNDLANKDGGERSAQIAQRVHATRRRQLDRFQGEPFCNAHMASQHLRNHCLLDAPGQALLKKAMDRLGLSARAYDRILKVARTIADLAESADIRSSHLGEAIQYRSLDRDGGI